LFEVEDNILRLTGTTKSIAEGRFQRKPVREYLMRQGRFAHFTDEDIEFFQKKIDRQWDDWVIPGVIAFGVEGLKALNKTLMEQQKG